MVEGSQRHMTASNRMITATTDRQFSAGLTSQEQAPPYQGSDNMDTVDRISKSATRQDGDYNYDGNRTQTASYLQDSLETNYVLNLSNLEKPNLASRENSNLLVDSLAKP